MGFPAYIQFVSGKWLKRKWNKKWKNCLFTFGLIISQKPLLSALLRNQLVWFNQLRGIIYTGFSGGFRRMAGYAGYSASFSQDIRRIYGKNPVYPVSSCFIDPSILPEVCWHFHTKLALHDDNFQNYLSLLYMTSPPVDWIYPHLSHSCLVSTTMKFEKLNYTNFVPNYREASKLLNTSRGYY